MADIHKDVVIVGGGPVGLFLAIALVKKKISCLLIEKRDAPVQHSRSLGIHPISLQLFEKYGILNPFLEAGLQISKGIAFAGESKIGEITFDSLPQPFNYVLSCPQYKTEAILEEELNKIDDRVLIRNTEFKGFEERENKVLSHVVQNGESIIYSSRYLVGCDGKNSHVRDIAGINFEGGPYPDTYVMGDFEDNTDFGSDAAVYIPKRGLVECFPLPNGMRRWVVKSPKYMAKPKREYIEIEVMRRCGHSLADQENVMLSGFGVQHYLADQFARGRIYLAGDAAHVISPIGGQGMNLGWLDGDRIAEVISNEELDTDQKANTYSKSQRAIVRKAMKRAEINMELGRAYSNGFGKKLRLNLILNTPLKKVMARLFTMQNLDRWWI